MAQAEGLDKHCQYRMHGKRLAFVLSIVILSWASAANAESVDDRSDALSNGQSSSRMSIDDIFSLKTAFGLPEADRATVSEERATPSPEERILARWKQKQLDRWEALPEGEFEINASAYTASADECGKSDGVTASGLRVAESRTLACPPQFPFGAKIDIDGLGVFRCEDRGGAIKGNRFDVYMKTKKEAFAFGRRHLVAQVVLD